MSEYFCSLPTDFLAPASQNTFKAKIDSFCEIGGAFGSSWLSVLSFKNCFHKDADSFRLGVLVVGLKYHKQTSFLGRLSSNFFLFLSFLNCLCSLEMLRYFFPSKRVI